MERSDVKQASPGGGGVSICCPGGGGGGGGPGKGVCNYCHS